MPRTETGDVAVVVKLFRATRALAVVAIAAAWRKSGGQAEGSARPPLVPRFLWVFVGLVGIGSMGAIPPAVVDGLSSASRACLVVAIAALGMHTSFLSSPAPDGVRCADHHRDLLAAALVLGFALLSK